MSLRTGLKLGVAVLAVSSAAVLVRWARADPLALSFWRTAGGAVAVGGAARRSPVRPRGGQWWWLAAAGAALGLHFATWLTSLEQTSVAASVTLVSAAPLVIAVWLCVSGRPPSRRTWCSIALALAGVVTIMAGDAGGGRQALTGDGLALVGAVMMAAYLTIGNRLRVGLPTAVYSGWTYAFAALGLGPVALAAGVPLVGFDARTWLVIGAIIAGPQLAGHTLLNQLLHELGSVTVSLALLVEPFGASLLVWLLFGEVPPLAVALGAPLVIAGLALQLA